MMGKVQDQKRKKMMEKSHKNCLPKIKITSNAKECGVIQSMKIKPNEISYDTGL